MSKMPTKQFMYPSGIPVMQGDVVVATGVTRRQDAYVELVIQPGTEDAKAYHCTETGGLLIRFSDGNLILSPSVDEDLQFVRRAKI
jgi:hypothetical protein